MPQERFNTEETTFICNLLYVIFIGVMAPDSTVVRVQAPESKSTSPLTLSKFSLEAFNGPRDAWTTSHRTPTAAGSLATVLPAGSLLIPSLDAESNGIFTVFTAPNISADKPIHEWGTFTLAELTNPLIFEAFSILSDEANPGSTRYLHVFGAQNFKINPAFSTYLSEDAHRTALHLFKTWKNFRLKTEGKLKGNLASLGYAYRSLELQKGKSNYTVIEPCPSSRGQRLDTELWAEVNSHVLLLSTQISSYLLGRINEARRSFNDPPALRYQIISDILTSWHDSLPHQHINTLEAEIIGRLKHNICNDCTTEIQKNRNPPSYSPPQLPVLPPPIAPPPPQTNEQGPPTQPLFDDELDFPTLSGSLGSLLGKICPSNYADAENPLCQHQTRPSATTTEWAQGIIHSLGSQPLQRAETVTSRVILNQLGTNSPRAQTEVPTTENLFNRSSSPIDDPNLVRGIQDWEGFNVGGRRA